MTDFEYRITVYKDHAIIEGPIDKLEKTKNES